MNNHEHLERFIDIIFALILGFVVSRFTTLFQIGNLSWDLEDIGKTIIFMSAVSILIYDWVAYHILIKQLPYSKEHYFLRFLIDLGIFYVMYLLFHVVLNDINFYIVLVIILFSLIFSWHFFAFLQVKESDDSSEQNKQLEITKKGMCNSAISIGLALLILIVLYLLPTNVIDNIWRNILVGIAIISYCVFRYRNVLNHA